MRRPHNDLKDRLLEVAGAFLPGIPKSKRQEELEYQVAEQRRRIERRRMARAGAHKRAQEHPSAKDYVGWMNLESDKKQKNKRGEYSEEN